MATVESGIANAFVDAIATRDVSGAVALLHPEIDFRAMTPNRIWEAEGPAGVEAILREWFEDPDEEVHGIKATEPVSLETTVRVGWLVHISDADGPHVFEQQAYVRERDARIAWMRVICSGWIPLPASS
jgi:SnoaL-like domain